MPKFSAASVETLDYDFTAIPRDDGEGMCEGRGVVPEPTKKRLKAFLTGLAELAGGETGTEELSPEAAISSLDLGELLENADADRGKLEDLLVGLTQGNPKKEQLAMLPPRYFSGFASWLIAEVSNPEV